MERVGIIAVGQTRYHPNRCDVNEEELAWEAIKPVLEESGLTLSEIGSACGFRRTSNPLGNKRAQNKE